MPPSINSFGLINLLVHVFVQKYQVSPSGFFRLNLVSIIEKLMQFDPFLLNFLKQIKYFSSKFKLLIRMSCFVEIINIILVSISMKNP